MVSRLQLRWALACLVVTLCSVFAERAYEVNHLVRALDNEATNRQFISAIRKWFSRTSGTQEMKTEAPSQTVTKTKIKYLPVYVPFPVRAPVKAPPVGEYYGAYQDPKKKDNLEAMYEGMHLLPHSHLLDYDLPYSSQLPVYMKRKEYAPYYGPLQVAAEGPYYHHHSQPQTPQGLQYVYEDEQDSEGYENDEVDHDDSSENDSVVVENPDLLKNLKVNKTGGSRVRKIRVKHHRLPWASLA